MIKNISHISRTAVISVLMVGFLAHLIMPFSSQAQKAAFTQWLNHNVITTGNESEIRLRNTIRELPDQSGNFRMLVQQASELVVNHKDDFRIHFSFADSEEQPQRVTSWLIGQWNVYQNHKTATNAILPEITQPVHKWISSQGLSPSATSRTVLGLPQHGLYESSLYSALPQVISLIPLAGGTAINAP